MLTCNAAAAAAAAAAQVQSISGYTHGGLPVCALPHGCTVAKSVDGPPRHPTPQLPTSSSVVCRTIQCMHLRSPRPKVLLIKQRLSTYLQLCRLPHHPVHQARQVERRSQRQPRQARRPRRRHAHQHRRAKHDADAQQLQAHGQPAVDALQAALGALCIQCPVEWGMLQRPAELVRRVQRHGAAASACGLLPAPATRRGCCRPAAASCAARRRPAGGRPAQ